MMNMVLIPDWVLRAVREKGAPMETVLDTFALSNILSPRDVGFYVASVEVSNSIIQQYRAQNKPHYGHMFRGMSPLHVDYYDWIEDATEVPSLDEKTRDRLLLIRNHYLDVRKEIDFAASAEENGDGERFLKELTATLWREPTVALSGNIPEEERKGLPGYVPELNFFPIVIRDPETLRRTGLDKHHLVSDQPAGKVVVIGATFSSAPAIETPHKVCMRSYSALMSILGTFMPTHQVLGNSILDGYIDAFFDERRLEDRR